MKPDLYIAAMGRSGSTLIENWLTLPGSQILFCEPNFFEQKLGKKTRAQCEDFNIAFNVDTGTPDSISKWLDHTFDDTFSGMKWGFKEVLCDLHTRCLEELDPAFVIITVRNIKDIYLSFIEKHKIQQNEDRFPPQWSFDYCVSESAQMVAFAQRLQAENKPHLIVNYESFVASPDYRDTVEKNSGWQGGGELTRNLGLFERDFEKGRHKGGLTGKTRDKSARQVDPQYLQKSEELAKQCAEYQSYFGYS